MSERKQVILRGVAASLSLVLAGQLSAQTFTTLHSFSGASEGSNPAAGLVLSGNTLYGTTRTGGAASHGTVFAISTDGTGFTNLHNFSVMNYSIAVGAQTNDDGAYAYSDLILSGNTLYGTASEGGHSGLGTIFAVDTDGTCFRTVYSFTGYPADASTPLAGVILSGSALYGVTRQGGGIDVGAVFKINTNGTGAATLHSFAGPDGCHSAAPLAVSGDALYGTAREGGASTEGTVFKVNLDGSGFSTLHNFTAAANFTNFDGAYPAAGLISTGSTLYGSAQWGGGSAGGTIFKLNIDGSGFATLHSFTSLSGSAISQTNSDGANPLPLLLSGTTLYGTARAGGSFGHGTVFQINLDGTGFATLHSFAGGTNEGAGPRAGLVQSGNTLYGTTEVGGDSDQGTVFSLELGAVGLPQPTIIYSGATIVLLWPTNVGGLTLESTANLASPGGWTTVSPEPGVVNGLYAVTNPVADAQRFFRLAKSRQAGAYP